MDSGFSNKSNTFHNYIQNNMVLLTKSIAMSEIVLDDDLISEELRNSVGDEKMYETFELDISSATFNNCDDYKDFLDDGSGCFIRYIM